MPLSPWQNLSLLFAWMQLVTSFPADGDWDARLLAALEDPCKLLHAFQVAATCVAAYTEPLNLCRERFSCSLPQQHTAVFLLFYVGLKCGNTSTKPAWLCVYKGVASAWPLLCYHLIRVNEWWVLPACSALTRTLLRNLWLLFLSE